MIGPEETNAGMLPAYGVVVLWFGLVVWLVVMAIKKSGEDK